MIRHRQGSDFLLITQNDHAVAAGLLAVHVGNGTFAPPSPFGPTITAISMHDSGWPLNDNSPLLDEQGFPLHVMESPPRISTCAWSESTARAAAVNDYTGLLVSLHGLRLSALVGSRGRPGHPADLFELNKFQHRQIEIQETLRKRLGLRIDRPLELGLANPGCDEDEDLLRFNYRLLTAMDQISLDACCSEPLFHSIDGVHPRPGTKRSRSASSIPRLSSSPWIPGLLRNRFWKLPFRTDAFQRLRFRTKWNFGTATPTRRSNRSGSELLTWADTFSATARQLDRRRI